MKGGDVSVKRGSISVIRGCTKIMSDGGGGLEIHGGLGIRG